MRIGMLLVRHPPDRKSPILPEIIGLLRERGATVDLFHPDDTLTDLSRVRVEHDLYVLKSGSEAALSLAGALHQQGAAILNPYPAAAALRDKIVSTRALQAAGVPVPETWIARDPEQLLPLLAAGPLVVKPYRGSQGRGVRVVHSPEDLLAATGPEGILFAQRCHRPDGPDCKLYCIGDRVFGVRRIWPPKTYEDKLGQPFDVTAELRDIALRCGEVFGLRLFGVDVVLSDGRPFVVDMQCFPGFKGVPDAAAQLAREIYAAGSAAAPRPRPIARTLRRELDAAIWLALKAGEVLRRHRAEGLAVGQKAGGEIVTAADREADALIGKGLRAEFPDDAVYSEESEDSPARLSARRVWVVDPIDATSDYAAGGEEHCISIGLAIDGSPALGVVYNPARDELFAGYEGDGVTCNGKPVQPSPVDRLTDALIEVSRKEWMRGLKDRAVGVTVRPAASMAYKLARVAAGLSDGAFSLKRRREWGTCAGVALVVAAGGRATCLDGRPPAFNRAPGEPPVGLIAASPALHGALLDAVRSFAPPG
jgi:ribosomal protein S6--L-glutamate ligase